MTCPTCGRRQFVVIVTGAAFVRCDDRRCGRWMKATPTSVEPAPAHVVAREERKAA